MSAESKQSQPSIDDILSSIREIIADDGTTDNSDASASEQVNGQGHSDIMSRLRGGDGAETPDDTSAEQGEDVLDLSEEFIVTEATAALRREQEQQAGANMRDPNSQEQDIAAQEQQESTADEEISPQEEDAPAAQADLLQSRGDEPGEDATISHANVWAQDFQMPVGEDGPASPFTATQTHPESAWPASDPFDVTESYKLARSLGGGRRLPEPHDEAPEAPAESASEAEPDPEPSPLQVDEPGIQLASLSDQQYEHDVETQADSAEDMPEAEPNDARPSPGAQAAEQMRAFHDADEIEAVFGMPPRSWSAASHHTDSTEASAPHDQDTGQADTDAPMFTQPHADEHHEPDMADDVDPASEDASEDVTFAADADTNAPHPSAFDIGAARMAGPHDAPASAPATGLGPTSAKSLEDSVKELLRPMLQEWLDKNMPRLVEAAMREQFSASQGAQPLPDETRAEPTRDDHD
jgi:cell pole-organizing protein PopZ